MFSFRKSVLIYGNLGNVATDFWVGKDSSGGSMEPFNVTHFGGIFFSILIAFILFLGDHCCHFSPFVRAETASPYKDSSAISSSDT